MKTLNYYSETVEVVLNSLETDSVIGLTSPEVVARQKMYGTNEINEKNTPSKLTLLLRQFQSPLVLILVFAMVATSFLGEWLDTVVIFLAVGTNAVLGFYQEHRAESAISHLRSFITVRTRVVREGKEMEIDARDVVPGDLVHLVTGSRVPADGRLLSAQNLSIDEAILTGESLPTVKQVTVLKEGVGVADRINTCFGGTLVTEGGGLMVVTTIGAQTEFGKIAELVSVTPREQTPLQLAMVKLAWVITIVVSLLVTGVFALGVSRGESIYEMFLVSVAVAVGAIPEALPIALTAVLAVGVERLSKRKGVMRTLTAAETLGSTTVVMTDKTGTLTEAKLELVTVATIEHIAKGTLGDKKIEYHEYSQAQKELVTLASAGTTVIIENPHEVPQVWRMSGSPLETTLVRTAGLMGIPVSELHSQKPYRLLIPFASTHKFSVTEGMLDLDSDLTGKEKGYAHIVVGAPDVLLSRTSMREEDKEVVSKYIETESTEGKRLLGVAVSYIDKASHTHGNHTPADITQLQFVGIISFLDPVRKEVPKAIKQIENFGVRVVIATGDLAGTAVAVARDLGWVISPNQVITGETMRQLSDRALGEALKEIRIFARVTPTDKLRIAKLYQTRGEIVAMTGDGVNDAPSLKAVNIGIAVGSGSDVAKGVADLILLDDNFQTIVSAIEEGKRVLHNIRKTFVYLMSSCLDEVFLIGGSLLLALPLPLTAMQIIWVNFFTGSLPAIAFAFDTNNQETGQVRKGGREIISGRVKIITFVVSVVSSGALFGLYYGLLKLALPLETVQTFIFVCFSSYILVIAYSFRNMYAPLWTYNPFSNTFMNYGVLAGFALLALSLTVPFLQDTFSTTSLSLPWYGFVFLWVVANVALVELLKWLVFRP